MSDELSDEACEEWHNEFWTKHLRRPTISEACREWHSRAEALIEQTFQDGVRKGCEISEVWTDREQVIETERRKAFEWGMRSMGYHCSEKQVEENYRVYTEAAKKEKGAPKAEQPCWKCGATKEIR